MEYGEGMVAVVRGLRDSGLAVTLLDGTRQYSLQPDLSHPTSHMSTTAAARGTSDGMRSENGVQATDGRYASTYKMMHCHLKPTSPQIEVTEFPPQRAELCPGHGNFEIGGCGSGERYQAKKSNSFRGGMNWPDKGSVFTSRPSAKPDSFASSLRKYPSMSPERSSEVMERLISFAQNKSGAKVKSSSPTRNAEMESLGQNFCLESLRNTSSSRPCRRNEPDINLMRHRRTEESPSRERCGQCELESWRRSTFSRSHDVRYLKEVTKVVKDGIRGMINNKNYSQRSISRNESPSPERRSPIQRSCNSVNMETQAAVQMVSREVVTSPRNKPSQRHVAVPLTPTTSNIDKYSQGVPSKNSQTVKEESISKSFPTKDDIELKAIRSYDDVGQQHLSLNKRSISDEEIRLRRNKNGMLRSLQNQEPKHSHKSKLKYKPKNNLKSSLKRQSYKDFLKNSSSIRRPHIYYTEIASKTIDEDEMVEVLEDWLGIIPLKPTDHCGRPIEKEFLFYDLFERLKYIANHLLDHNRREKIKSDIIELLNEFPVEIKGNKNIFLGRLADILLERLKNLNKSTWSKKSKHESSLNSLYNFVVNRYIPPTENELRKFLTSEINEFVKNTGLTIARYSLLELEEDLLDIVVVYVENLQSNDDYSIRREIMQVLIDYGFSEYQSSRFSHILLKHIREVFLHHNKGQIRSENLIILPSVQHKNTPISTNGPTEHSINSINDTNANYLMEVYTKQLCEQINEWLSSIQTLLPRINERGFRQVVVNDLAGDIIERHKYLEMNPASKGSDEVEMEHLRYQIFKWINKLADEDTLQPSEHAPELMKRIQSIPVPMLTRPIRQISRRGDDVLSPSDTHKMQSIEPYGGSISNAKLDHSIHDRLNTTYETPKTASIFSTSCSKTCSQKGNETCGPDMLFKQTSSSIERINHQYEQFIKDWVQKIPILASTHEETALAEKARLGIHNGIWKAITKLKCDPSIFSNRFLLEDLLDDEIEDLLNCLPQTPELKSKKHILKLELINKTTETVERIRAENTKNYRQKLQQNMDTYLQKEGLSIENDNTQKAQEELEILRIVELFILHTKFKDDDIVKSEVYRKRLLQEAKELIDNIKKSHSQTKTKVNYAVIIIDIMNSLQQVPVPGDNTIKEEVDNILLEFEIENWLDNLPIYRDVNNAVELLHFKKKTDNLAQQIRDLKNNEVGDVYEKNIRSLISNFLDRTPMRKDEMINKKSMIEELVNRIKNIDQSKRVAFHEPGEYNEFCQNVPPSSSFDKFLKFKPGENLTRDESAVNYEVFADRRPLSSSFKNNDDNSLVTPNIIPSNSANDSVLDYSNFAAVRPKSSSLNETPNDNLYTIHNGNPQINVQSGTPDCCKTTSDIPTCCKSQNVQKVDRLDVAQATGSNYQKLGTPEPGRTQRDVFNTSRGIVFKDVDNLSQATVNQGGGHKLSQISNLGVSSVECQTARYPTASNHEIDDVQISQDGNRRTIATNTPKRGQRSMINVEAARKHNMDLDGSDDELRCRCIERYWRCKKRFRRIASDGLDNDLTDCFPFIYTCPCFY